jgi:hypothetical protein
MGVSSMSGNGGLSMLAMLDRFPVVARREEYRGCRMIRLLRSFLVLFATPKMCNSEAQLKRCSLQLLYFWSCKEQYHNIILSYKIMKQYYNIILMLHNHLHPKKSLNEGR